MSDIKIILRRDTLNIKLLKRYCKEVIGIKYKDLKYFSQHDVKRLFQTIRESNKEFVLRDLIAFRLIYFCSLSPSEIRMLKVKDFNKLNNRLYCIRIKNKKNNIIDLGINQNLLNEFLLYVNKITKEHGEDSPLFLSKHGKIMHRTYFDLLMKEYCTKTNIKDESMYNCGTLRRSIIVHLIESGAIFDELLYWVGSKNSKQMQYEYEILFHKLKKSNVIV